MSSLWLHLYIPGNPAYVLSSPFRPGTGDPKLTAGQSRLESSVRPRVLVVDDERIIADSLTAILNRSGFDAVARYGGEDAVAFIHEQCPDIVLSDVFMPETNGIQLAHQVLANCPSTRIVLISGNASTPNLLEHALPEGTSFELLAKPIHPLQLLKILRGTKTA